MRSELIAELRYRHATILSEAPEILCGDGWFNLLDCLMEALSGIPDASAMDIRVEGVKSKYGSLRVDWTGRSQSADALLNMAEALSERTCEMCGAPGIKIDRAGWMSTLCKEHDPAAGSERSKLQEPT